MFVRSIPNLLGLFRVVTTPVLFVLILLGTAFGYIAALGLLLVMAVTDIVDGKIARKLQVVSPLGVFLDTTSDKIFVTGALIPMVERDLLAGWVALVIILRDFLVSGLRSYAAAEGHVISAGPLGKQKLVITVTALIWRLTAAAVDQLPGAPAFVQALASAWPLVVGLAVAWTVLSGLEYFWKAWPMLVSHWSPRPAAEDGAPTNVSAE